MPSPSESAQDTTDEVGIATFVRSVLACGDFPQPASATRQTSASSAPACTLRHVCLFSARFIVNDRSLRRNRINVFDCWPVETELPKFQSARPECQNARMVEYLMLTYYSRTSIGK